MEGSDIEEYIARFRYMAILCPKMITLEGKKIERLIWGLSPLIQGSVIAADPTTFDSAKRLAQKIIDHGVQKGMMTLITEPKKDKKKKWGKKRKGKQSQGSTKKQQIVAVHAATTPAVPTPAKPYSGSLPKCNKCNFHNKGTYGDMQCTNYKRIGHTARYCRTPSQPNN